MREELDSENPSLSRVVKINPAVYPHLVVNYDFRYFSLLKVDKLNLKFQNQAKIIPWHSLGSPEVPNHNLGQIGQMIHEL